MNLGTFFTLTRLIFSLFSKRTLGALAMIVELFTRHPASVGETYAEHMQTAAGFGLHLLRAALACFVHALLPFLFERTGSTAIHALHGAMVTNRLRHDDRIRDGVPAC